MKLSLLQENLLKGLTRAGKNVSLKPQLPILQNVLLEAKDGLLYITSTNLETTERASLGAKVDKEGALCLPSRLLTEFVQSLPQGGVTLEAKGESLRVIGGKSEAVVQGVLASEFPPFPASSVSKKQIIDKDQMVSALSLVLFAASSDEGRPILTGVRIKNEEKDTMVVATDGYRLSLYRLEGDLIKGLDAVIPSRALLELSRLLQEEKDQNGLSFSMSQEHMLLFSFGNTEIATRALDGEYPDFGKIIPQKHTTRVIYDKKELHQAVRSAAIFAKDNANIVRLRIEEKNTVISSNTPQAGESRVSLDGRLDGEGGEIAFNSRFILDLLSVYQEDEIAFEMTGALNSGVFRSVKHEGFLHIIMPVRVSGAE
ncbi:DNA polymerase III subunit beta [Patescibacteria group bacterium]|nr:DNA polymerase III subunit beta [Patescibacteria group bacterium]